MKQKELWAGGSFLLGIVVLIALGDQLEGETFTIVHAVVGILCLVLPIIILTRQ